MNDADDHSGALHSTLALCGPRPPGAKKLPPDWRILPRRGTAEPKREILWEHKTGAKYNGFVVAPGTILAAGQTPSRGSANPFLAAVSIDDGSELWREALPAAVVKGGTAMDHKARIFVSLEDGRILCFAAPE